MFFRWNFLIFPSRVRVSFQNFTFTKISLYVPSPLYTYLSDISRPILYTHNNIMSVMHATSLFQALWFLGLNFIENVFTKKYCRVEIGGEIVMYSFYEWKKTRTFEGKIKKFHRKNIRGEHNFFARKKIPILK
jgi:hypothetical protein